MTRRRPPPRIQEGARSTVLAKAVGLDWTTFPFCPFCPVYFFTRFTNGHEETEEYHHTSDAPGIKRERLVEVRYTYTRLQAFLKIASRLHVRRLSRQELAKGYERNPDRLPFEIALDKFYTMIGGRNLLMCDFSMPYIAGRKEDHLTLKKDNGGVRYPCYDANDRDHIHNWALHYIDHVRVYPTHKIRFLSAGKVYYDKVDQSQYLVYENVRFGVDFGNPTPDPSVFAITKEKIHAPAPDPLD